MITLQSSSNLAWPQFLLSWSRKLSTKFILRAKASLHRDILLKATSELLVTTDSETMLKNIVQHLVPSFGDWCLVNLVGPDGDIRRFTDARCMSQETSSALDQWRQSFPANLNVPWGIAHAIRSGRPQLVLLADELRSGSKDSAYLAPLLKLGVVSFISAPIKVHGKVYGGMAIDSLTPGRIYDQSDVELIREITNLMGLALERAELLKEVIEANHHKDQFLAMLSHELRTPISVVLGWSNLILKKAQDPSFDLYKAVATIQTNARLQKSLVDDLLDLTLVSMGRLQIKQEKVDLNLLLQSAVDSTLPLAENKHLSLRLSILEEPALVLGDASRLQQVVLNLLQNAMKFTPEEGRIDIQLLGNEHSYTIRVKDNGIGIAAEFLPFVFERFCQANQDLESSTGGLGLGLALVHHIVHLHRGWARAESEGIGRGTTMTVELLKVQEDELPKST